MFAVPARVKYQQVVPASIKETWDFFSQPKNLKRITPDYMDFKVHTPQNELEFMYPGQIISYTVKPVLGIPVKWTTEITQVKEGRFFIDEQRSGPYKMWHHQHHFEEVPGGTKMTDIVHYLLPLGLLGTVARKLFIEKQLEEIFTYRKKVTTELFGVAD